MPFSSAPSSDAPIADSGSPEIGPALLQNEQTCDTSFERGTGNRRQFLQSAVVASAALPLSALSAPARAAEPPARKWRIAVIGHTGHGHYGHGLDTCWLQLPEAEVVAFADADESGRKAEQGRLPGTKAFADYRTMLDEVRPDVVAVAPRWIDEHCEMILAAISAGARGIYCEKPFCRTPEEADRIQEQARRSGCRIAIAHRNRYHPALPVVKKLVSQGMIGTLLELRGRGKEDHRGGCLDLWVLGSHVMDAARGIAGDARSCSALIQQGERPATSADLLEGDEGVGLLCGDRLHARFDMQNGVPFYFDSIRNAGVASANFGLQLIGNGGVIDIRIDREPIAHLRTGSPFQPTGKTSDWVNITSAGVGKPEPIDGLGPKIAGHQFACRDLLDAIAEERPAACSEQDGAATVEMIHAIFQSHVREGANVTFPLKNRGNIFEAWRFMG